MECNKVNIVYVYRNQDLCAVRAVSQVSGKLSSKEGQYAALNVSDAHLGKSAILLVRQPDQ